MHVALRKGDNDTGFAEDLFDPEAYFAFNAFALDGAFNYNPEVDVKNQGVVPEIRKQNKRDGRGLDPGIITDRLQ